MNRAVLGLRCTRCGAEFEPRATPFVCPCASGIGSDLGTLDVVYDARALRPWAAAVRPLAVEALGMAVFAPLLPLRSVDSLSPLPVGGTPLRPAARLGRALELPRLWIKDDGRNPSGSLKDRASAVAVAHARELGRAVLAVASTGNAAASLACQGAAAGLETIVFIPRDAPVAKLAQVVAHGSRVFAVDGSYDDAYALCMAACAQQDWYNRSTGFNPFMTEGKKTVALEIAAQLAVGTAGAFAAPDAVFVAVGDGCILGGVHKGFADLHALGLIDRVPRLFGVQSDASAALHDAWRAGAGLPAPVRATTRADSIRVDAPRDAAKALRAVRATEGRFVLVSDDAILDAVVSLARSEGVFAEPAGAAALAGVAEARRHGWLDARDQVVVISTGSGLKDPQASLARVQPPTCIEPSLGALQRHLPPPRRAPATAVQAAAG